MMMAGSAMADDIPDMDEDCGPEMLMCMAAPAGDMAMDMDMDEHLVPEMAMRVATPEGAVAMDMDMEEGCDDDCASPASGGPPAPNRDAALGAGAGAVVRDCEAYVEGKEQGYLDQLRGALAEGNVEELYA